MQVVCMAYDKFCPKMKDGKPCWHSEVHEKKPSCEAYCTCTHGRKGCQPAYVVIIKERRIK